jgi:hypothetical protein
MLERDRGDDPERLDEAGDRQTEPRSQQVARPPRRVD